STYYDRMLVRLRDIPGVLDVTYSLYSPMEGNNWQSSISILGRQAGPRPESSSWNRIGPRYFETLGTGLRRGPTIDDRATAPAPRAGRGRSRPDGQSRAADGSAGQPELSVESVDVAADGGVRPARARRGRHRPLRRDGIRGGPAYARDRRAHGARRQSLARTR